MTAANVEHAILMDGASASLDTADLHASRIAPTSALTRVTVLKVLACALLAFWVLTAPSRAAAMVMVLVRTQENVSTSTAGEEETAPSC